VIGYFIIRLGADSEAEIRQIDNCRKLTTDSLTIHVICKQVPKGISPDDLAFIWLGTNNNKGGKTLWVQGIRALGTIKEVSGDDAYGAAKRVTIELGIILPQSITKMDFVSEPAARYADIAAMPVLGVNNYSSQVVQRIDPDQPGQSLHSLLGALDRIVPGFQTARSAVYPWTSEISSLNPSNDRQPDIFSLPHLEEVDINTKESLVDIVLGQHDENVFDDDDTRDRDADIESPFDPTKIDIIAKPITISALEDRLDNDELNLTPDFQRQANVWDAKRKARLIESILLRIPLPSFYFSEDFQGTYAVVDGLQRLCAVFHFKNPSLLNSATGANLTPLRLRDLQYLKELEGKSFTELERKFQRRISELEVTANIIRANTPSAVKFNVFARLNQGGMALNGQEIRNAIFPGEWRNYVRTLAESNSFITATEGRVRTDRQQDMELVLRYLSLWALGDPYKRQGKQTLDEFLNSTVENTLLHWTAQKWSEAITAFHRAVQSTLEIRGRHAFRKSTKAQQRKPINRGLFEAELVVFGSLSEAEVSTLTLNRTKLDELLGRELEENPEFIKSLLYGTGSADSSNARVATLKNIANEIIHA
jgi:hypothetical protein